MDQPNEEIRQGMATEVSMSFGRPNQENRIFVQPKAVVEDAGGRFCFVAVGEPGGEGRVERREVRTGDLTEDGLEILDGLAEGDLLVTAGLRFLEAGRVVRIPELGE